MAYIAAKDVPLYFSTDPDGGATAGEADANNRAVVANQVQLNYTPNIAPTRVVGKEVDNKSFLLAGPPNATLSFSAYVGPNGFNGVHDEFDIADYTGVQNTGALFRIGDLTSGISGSGAYLTSYSMTVSPYAPVIFQADFAIYNPLTTTTAGNTIFDAGTDGVLDEINFERFGHGVYSRFGKTPTSADNTVAKQEAALAGTHLSDISIVESVSYQYSAQYLPNYKIGSYNIQVGTDKIGAQLVTAQHSFQIQGDNIQSLVPITGSQPGSMDLQIRNASNTTLLTVTVDGTLNAENITLAGGDLARGSVTITELLV